MAKRDLGVPRTPSPNLITFICPDAYAIIIIVEIRSYRDFEFVEKIA
jgi:hypothetical protein